MNTLPLQDILLRRILLVIDPTNGEIDYTPVEQMTMEIEKLYSLEDEGNLSNELITLARKLTDIRQSYEKDENVTFLDQIRGSLSEFLKTTHSKYSK